MRCRICDKKMEFLEYVKDRREGALFYNTKPLKDSSMDFSLYACSDCTHIQSDCSLDEQLYDDEYSAESGFNQYYGNLNQTENIIVKNDYIQRSAIRL